MDRYTANRYIWLKDKIAAGGSVPQELLDEVAALDATVNGDETSEPPVVGLVDVVGDLEETVEDLDIDINGDGTTEPPTPGLLSRVSDLESNNYDTQINIISATVDNPYVTPAPGIARVYNCAIRIGDASKNVLLLHTTSSTDYSCVYLPKGVKIYPYNLVTDSAAVFMTFN